MEGEGCTPVLRGSQLSADGGPESGGAPVSRIYLVTTPYALRGSLLPDGGGVEAGGLLVVTESYRELDFGLTRDYILTV